MQQNEREEEAGEKKRERDEQTDNKRRLARGERGGERREERERNTLVERGGFSRGGGSLANPATK